MAIKPKPQARPISADPPQTPISWDGYVQVTLKRAVVVAGHVYRPGATHVVDATTLAAMGDAVASQQAMK